MAHKYPVLDSLVHDTQRYEPGDTVELTPKQAEVLKALKVIGDPLKDKPDPKAADPKAAKEVKTSE